MSFVVHNIILDSMIISYLSLSLLKIFIAIHSIDQSRAFTETFLKLITIAVGGVKCTHGQRARLTWFAAIAAFEFCPVGGEY